MELGLQGRGEICQMDKSGDNVPDRRNSFRSFILVNKHAEHIPDARDQTEPPGYGDEKGTRIPVLPAKGLEA